MSKENSECINQLAESPKIKECENALRKNLENANGDVCSALDQTLSCTKSALLSCGRNTLSYVTNIVTTIKANMDDCILSGGTSGGDDDVESVVRTVINRPSLSITSIQPSPKRPSTTSSKKPSNRLPSRIFPSLKARCPPFITVRASATCFPLLNSRSVKQALTPRPGEFILTNFDTSNIVTFCEQSSHYRKCLEDLYSNDDACLSNLKEDAFYSFIVAFEDKFCEQEKQIEWLINAGCLKETTDKLSVKRCLLNSGLDEDRAFCKVKQQMTDCVMDSIISNCRAPEVKFFERIYDGMHLRNNFCTPTEKPTLGTVIGSKSDDDEDSESDNVVKTAVFSNECLRARQLALIREESYIPECRATGTFQPMQCDRYNGSCFCVDELTGIPFSGTASGPGSPLPLCGLKSLFTCEKLPSKIFCEVDGTIAQKTERWYRRGDHCAMYLHDYCAQQSHIPPIPLRTKSDCQRFCLPPTR